MSTAAARWRCACDAVREFCGVAPSSLRSSAAVFGDLQAMSLRGAYDAARCGADPSGMLGVAVAYELRRRVEPTTARERSYFATVRGRRVGTMLVSEIARWR